MLEVQVPQSEGEDDEVRYEAYDSKEDNLKEEIAKDIGWGFTPNDRSSEGDILNHYFSSFPISEGEKTQEVSCFIVFEGMLFTGLSDGTIRSWDISTGNMDNEFQTSEEGKTRAFDHTKKISGVGFTKTLGSHHSKMVSTSWDCKETAGNNIIIWDYDGKNTKKVKYYKYATKIVCLHVTRLAPFAVFASDDKKIHVWDLDDPYPKHRFQTNHTDRILSLGTVLRLKEQDSKMGIISVGWDKQIIRHTLFAPTTKHSPPFETPQSTKVTPGKDYWKSHVFAKGHSKGITCVEVHFPYGPRYRAIKPDGGDPDALDESQSGFLSMLLDEAPILLTGSLDNTIIIWDFENAGKIRHLKGHLAQVHAIKVSDRNDDGLPPIIISASADCSIILWDLVYGRRIRSIQHCYPLTALSIEDSAAGIILFSTDQNAALVWDLRHTKRTKRFKTGAVTTIDTYSTTNAEDKILVGCVGNEYYVCSLNNSTSKNPTSLPVKIPTYHEIRINATVVYQPKITKDPIIISGDAVGKLSIWTIASKNDKPQSGTPKNLPLSLQADRFEVLAIGLYDPYVFGRKRGSSRINTTNDTRFDLSIPFVIVSGTEKMLRFYDFTGQYTNFNFLPPSSNYLILEKQSGHQKNICSIVVFHPTEKTDPPLFLTGSHDGTVKLWDLETLAWLRIFSGEQLSRIHSLVVYDPSIQFPLSTTTTEVTSSVFKEEEQSKETALITAADDGKVCIWSLLKSNQAVGEGKSFQGILRHSFQAHQEVVTALALYIPKQTEQHPLLVTGSTDKLIHIWDLFTREKLNTLIGHHDRVCWLKVYDPPHLLHPMLFSGGDDEQTIVWKDFLYGTSFMPLRDMVRNAFIADYQISMCDWPTISSLAKQQRDPYSFFAENSQLFTMAVNYHRSDFLIQFFDYLVATLPTIQPYFYCRKKENTSNTEKEIALPFSSKHAGIGSLFRSDLFHQDDHVTTTDQYRLIQLDQYERVTEKNIDFLQHSSEVIHLDLLKLAILKSETRAVHIIVLAWLKLLNQDMDSILMQRIFHPMYYLPLTTIKCLFEHCPNEFVFFIRNLRLIQSHDSTMGDIPREMKLARRGGMEIRQSNRKINTFKDFWKPLENRQERAKIDEEESFVEQQLLAVGHNRFVIRFLFWLEKTIVQWWEEFRPSFFGKPAMEKEVSSMIVPFRSCKDLMIYLQWFVTASDKSDDLQIFNSEVVTVIVRYLWFVRGRRRHLVALLKYLMFFMIFLSCITFFEPRHGSSWRVIILNILTATFLLVYYGPQIQLNKLKFSITGNQIGDLWDILELITVLLGLIGMIIRLYYYDTGTTVGRHLLAVSAVGMWFKILYFLRPFSTTGPLVAMIIEIAGELFAFFVILFSLFTGIIFGFWFLSSSPSQPNFLLKEVDYSRVSTTILMGLLFGIIILIIVINFCLTIIGNILTRIKQRDTAWLMKERAKVMLKEQQSLENHYDGIAGNDRLFHFKNYLLVLKYREEVKKGTIDIAKELEGYLTQNEIQLLRKVSLSHEG